MANDDWFRNTTWNNQLETEFEGRLKRSRGAFNKAQYLRIQASYLLDSNDKNVQLVGVRLITRMINDFPTEESSFLSGNEQLGDYYLKHGDLRNAEQYFRIVSDSFKNGKSRNGTSWIADLKLVEVILITNQSAKFEEAYKIGADYDADELILNSDLFYYNELMALLCYRMNKKGEAKFYAKKAIEISEINQPQFSRHKKVGLVQIDNGQLRTLEEISKS